MAHRPPEASHALNQAAASAPAHPARPLRVVHVNTERTCRGGENQVFNLMRGLRERGDTIELVGLPGGALGQRCRADGMPVLDLAMRSDADLRGAWRLARHLKRHPADIIHAQTARAHSIAVLARLFGAPGRVVVSRRIDFPVRRDPINLWKYRSRLVARYIAVAGVIREVLTAAGVRDERVTVIHSSIDLARFDGAARERAAARAELGIAPDAFVIGNVAALAWHKGQKDLVAAFAQVVAARPAARLVIVGSGEEEATLRSQAAAPGLEGRVIFTGQRADVPRLLAALDLFCMPSYKEGFCNAVLEAFAMGLPVVATRAGGLPEIVDDGVTGLLAPPADPPALAAALLRMMEAPDRARRMGEAGHRIAHERFGVDHMVNATRALYAEVAGSGPR